MLLLGAGSGAGYLRGRSRSAAPQEAGLSKEEQDRLRQILDE
jgi:hypothetical protein